MFQAFLVKLSVSVPSIIFFFTRASEIWQGSGLIVFFLFGFL